MNLPHIEADIDFREVIQECDRVLTVKGHDYTQGQGRLKNFYTNAERLDVPASKVLAVYFFKHIDAIETFLRDGQVKSEPIEGRIVDAINYLLLLAKLVRAEQKDVAEDIAKALDEAAQ